MLFSVPIQVAGGPHPPPEEEVATFFWVDDQGEIAKTIESVAIRNGVAVYNGDQLPHGAHWAITVHDVSGLPIFRSGPLAQLPGPAQEFALGSQIRIFRVSSGALFGIDSPDGVPELVAAELVRNVVEPKEFHEFCQFDCLTVLNGDKYYRIPRRPHGLIEVWDAKTRRAVARLCVVFQDPGMPPSDEVVMKYLLAKHQPDLLWQVGVRFSPPTGKFEVTPPRRWSVD